MNPRVSGILIGIIVVACFVTGALVYNALPSTVATHWDAAGHANGMAPRAIAAFVFPAIMAVMALVWYVLPKIDPIAPGFTGFRHVYDFAWILIISFFAYVYAETLRADLGMAVNMLRVILPALGALFVVLGALLPLIKRNWFFGIRTPWTLSSDAVWLRTHKLGSILFMIAGLCIFAGTYAPQEDVAWFIALPIAAAIVIAVAYSYVIYRNGPGGQA